MQKVSVNQVAYVVEKDDGEFYRAKDVEAALTARDAEIEARGADILWVHQHGARCEVLISDPCPVCDERDPASIIAAVRRARESAGGGKGE